jgi:predicted acylesterase/phospholipase RssA
MLKIQPAGERRAGGKKLALALAGGGPLGAFYELGALHALSEAIEGAELTDFDVYVGVSSGSLLAGALANGFDTTAIGSSFIHDEATIPFSPDTLLEPAVGEYLRRMATVPRSLATLARQFMREPLHASWPSVVGSLSGMVPTALFDNRPLERYLHEVFSSPGHSDEFGKLRSRLYLVATNLNTGESVAFGDARHSHVPISRAAIASAALPGLYPAVEIDGEHYVDGALIRTVHASLALEAGADLLICVNPLVPYDASGGGSGRSRRNLADEGLPAIMGQSLRALIHSRMHVGMASYSARFPRADVLLLEPDRHDERLFFANVFRYTGRSRLVEHAYQRTRHDLLSQADRLSRALERHGLTLNRQLLRDRRRTFATAGKERATRVRRTAKRLDHALHRLEALLAHGRLRA